MKPQLVSQDSQIEYKARLSVHLPNKLTTAFISILYCIVAIIGMLVVFLIKIQHDIQYELRDGLNKGVNELEQLRTDVITSASENTIFLKIMLLKPGVDKTLAREIAHSIIIRSREHHRDPDLVLAIIDVESDFKPNAISEAGAMGLMQIMPLWKKAFGIERDLRDVDTSINYGLKILGSYEQTFGSLELALTAYNRGPNLVSEDMKYGRLPFNGYAESVMNTYSRIKSWTRF